MNINELISKMTLEEKASLCSGKDFWNTKGIERLNIPSIMMTDGPHGLRKQGEQADHLGLNGSIENTCFPTACAIACSFDRELVEEMGQAIGKECQAEDVSIILGPGTNIKRSPLCGRNFEYYSEDPYLSSELAKSHINGVQSEGVGTSLKHFAANNQEHRRMTIDTLVDERTLREIYLASFESAVKEAQPWTVMCSYNKLNGDYTSEHKRLLTTILKEEWGYTGYVVSDWGAVNDRVKGLDAGLELQMPSDGGIGDLKIVEAVKNGELSEEVLDNAVRRLLNITFKTVEYKRENATYNIDEHHNLARKIGRESIVLLKNEDSILPLNKEESVAVIGEFAKKPRYQGGGSSHINPTKLTGAYEEMLKESSNVFYARGYDLESDDVKEDLINEAKEISSKCDKVVLFVGLPERYESEGFDRSHMNIPNNHQVLIEEISKVNKNIVIVLSNGSPVEMPWINDVKCILEAYLSGQASGGAISDILYGVCSPSGKLAETFPVRLVDNPSYLNFPGEGDLLEYKEGIFVGYRYYDTKCIDVLFPFGYGLSYTTFKYSNLEISKNSILDTDEIEVKVRIKNTGNVAGKEVVQLYVRDVKSKVRRPEKELKGFDKVFLQPGEEKEVTFLLNKRSFAYYNVGISDWYVESGEFEILVGKSSRDIALRGCIEVKGTTDIRNKAHMNSTIGDVSHTEAGKELRDKLTSALGSVELGEGDFLIEMVGNMPLRACISFANVSEEELDKAMESMND